MQVIPTANSAQLTFFLRGQIDAAWAPEPWAARLVRDAGARILVDERTLWPGGEFTSTEVIASPKFLKEHPDLVKAFLRTHVALTEWIGRNPAEAKQVINLQLRKEMGKPLAPGVLDDAFSRVRATYDPLPATLLRSADHAFEEGFLGRTKPDLSNLYDLTLLNEVLRERKARPVQ